MNKFLDELNQVNADGIADLFQFDQIQTPLPALVVANQRLRLVKPCPQLNLRQSRLFADTPEELLQVRLLCRVDRLLHSQV